MTNRYIRKRNRYKNYDYSKDGAYFITICSKDKKQIFSKIDINFVTSMSSSTQKLYVADDRTVDVPIDKRRYVAEDSDRTELYLFNDKIVYPCLQLTDLGLIVEKSIIELGNFSQNFDIDRYVIMPNHIHMIIFLYDHWMIKNMNVAEDSEKRRNVAEDSDRTVDVPSDTNPKYSIPNIVKFFKRGITLQCGDSIWHKSYYDRIIRNEKEYNNIAQYIINNPANWMIDEYYVEI